MTKCDNGDIIETIYLYIAIIARVFFVQNLRKNIMGMYYLFALLASLLFLAGLLIVKKFKKDKTTLYLRISGIIVGLFLIFRYLWADLYLENVINQVSDGFSSKGDMIFSSIISWIEVTAILIVILYPFFVKVKTLKILSWFVAPVILLFSFIFINKILIFNFGPVEANGFSIRALFFAFEYAGITLGRN